MEAHVLQPVTGPSTAAAILPTLEVDVKSSLYLSSDQMDNLPEQHGVIKAHSCLLYTSDAADE